MRYHVPGRIETWEGRVDAHDGQVVDFHDSNLHGRATGGVYKPYPRVSGSETIVPFAALDVFAAGLQLTDDCGAGLRETTYRPVDQPVGSSG